MNNAPFKVGQKVVAVVDTPALKNGNVYTVFGIRKDCKCKNPYSVHIGLKSQYQFMCCSECGVRNVPNEGVKWFSAKFFAPIEETKERIRYVAVSETLREQAVEVAAIKTN